MLFYDYLRNNQAGVPADPDVEIEMHVLLLDDDGDADESSY